MAPFSFTIRSISDRQFLCQATYLSCGIQSLWWEYPFISAAPAHFPPRPSFIPLPVEFFRLYGGDVTIKSTLSLGIWRIVSMQSPQTIRLMKLVVKSITRQRHYTVTHFTFHEIGRPLIQTLLPPAPHNERDTS